MNFKTLIILLVSAMIIWSCGEPPIQEPIVGDVAIGEAIFQSNCIACHQSDGKGKSGLAPSINNIDFLAIADDHLIKRFILEGRTGTTMIPFKNIPDVATNIDDLVAYMRSWSKDYALYKEIVIDKSWESQGDATNGSALFTTFCAACHGNDGQGYSAKGSGTGIGNPAFVSMVSDDYIKQTLLLGRAGTAMKPFDGAKGVASLSNAEMDDIVSFLRTKGEYKMEQVSSSSVSSSNSVSATTDMSMFTNPYFVIIMVMLVFFALLLIYMMFIIKRIKGLILEDEK